ncbi:MAG: cyclic nucleotide-binding domain-containing protein [Actinomycetia bacterium]|nr:cyclic nucleotide-binding domain-containing protein [Actinomycetes bacterium]
MNLEDLRATSDLLARLDDEHLEMFEELSSERDLAYDERLFRENDEANEFFIVTNGIMALEMTRPALPPATVQTLGAGELLGLSWRIDPHRWMWTARAMTPVRLAAFNAAEMRDTCARDPELDRLMWEIIATQASKRLHQARIQLLDLYGKG